MTVYCQFCDSPTDWLTMKQTAALLGEPKSTVQRWLRAGRFPGAEKVRGRSGAPWIWRVPATAVLPLVQGKGNEAGAYSETEEDEGYWGS